jgi:hypothetical protein
MKIGRLFTLGSLFKIAEEAQIFELLFPTIIVLIWTKKVGLHFWAIFSQTLPVDLLSCKVVFGTAFS